MPGRDDSQLKQVLPIRLQFKKVGAALAAIVKPFIPCASCTVRVTGVCIYNGSG